MYSMRNDTKLEANERNPADLTPPAISSLFYIIRLRAFSFGFGGGRQAVHSTASHTLSSRVTPYFRSFISLVDELDGLGSQ